MKKVLLKKGWVVVAILLSFMVAPISIKAEPTKIKNNVIKVNGKLYRRIGAESATLGAVGSKKANGPSVGYFVRDSEWKAGKVKVQVHRPIQISQKSLTNLAGKVAVLFGNGNGTVRVGSTTRNNRNFSIMKIDFVDHGQVINAFNSHLSKSERKRIKKLKRGRMITAVWVLVAGGNETTTSSLNGEGSFNMVNGEMLIRGNASGNANATTEVKFPVGSIVAYEFSKMKWKPKKRLKKLQVDTVSKIRI